jgi:hypothetical protein
LEKYHAPGKGNGAGFVPPRTCWPSEGLKP